MAMNVVLGHYKFSLQATKDQYGPSMYPGHFTASIHEENLSVIAGWQPFHASLVRPARATQPLTQCLYWMHPTNKSS